MEDNKTTTVETTKPEVNSNYKYSYISQDITKYDRTIHTIGRLWMLLILILLVSTPFIIAAMFNTTIDGKVFADSGVWILILSQWIGAIAEVFIYCGMLGRGGSYLAFVTGNLSNLKIPCALNALDVAGTKAGTKEGEIVSTIAVASSSIVTTLIIAIGVAAFVPLTPVFNNPVYKPAFGAVVYALFGAMLVKYVIENPKLFVLPFIVATIIGCAAPRSLGDNVMIMMILCAVVAMGFGLILLKKNKI